RSTRSRRRRGPRWSRRREGQRTEVCVVASEDCLVAPSSVSGRRGGQLRTAAPAGTGRPELNRFELNRFGEYGAPTTGASTTGGDGAVTQKGRPGQAGVGRARGQRAAVDSRGTSDAGATTVSPPAARPPSIRRTSRSPAERPMSKGRRLSAVMP